MSMLLLHRWWRSLWDWASTYLPVIMMGLMALGTWWLVKQTPLFEPPRAPAAPVHEPDYWMSHFTVHRFDAQGVLRMKLKGDEGRHYPDTNMLEVDNVRLRAVGLQGEITTAQALLGLSNHDGSELRLKGEAVVEREAMGDTPAITFIGESLLALVPQQQLISTEPVTIERAGLRVVTSTLHYEHGTQVAQTRGKVHATFNSVAK
jgi:lipopolysaccharide export system protein LptC